MVSHMNERRDETQTLWDVAERLVAENNEMGARGRYLHPLTTGLLFGQGSSVCMYSRENDGRVFDGVEFDEREIREYTAR